MSIVKPKYNLGDKLVCSDNRFGKVTEITLFRRDLTIGYGLVSPEKKAFFVGEDEVTERVK